MASVEWAINYDRQKNDFYGLVAVSPRKWAYRPEVCDFENCIEDCDRCPLSKEEEEAEDE